MRVASSQHLSSQDLVGHARREAESRREGGEARVRRAIGRRTTSVFGFTVRRDWKQIL